jgi:hypothetical protein
VAEGLKVGQGWGAKRPAGTADQDDTAAKKQQQQQPDQGGGTTLSVVELGQGCMGTRRLLRLRGLSSSRVWGQRHQGAYPVPLIGRAGRRTQQPGKENG